ncbi:hypothetical protein ACFU6I_43320 [Streptomyces sp. NPDC057486]|uniref:hypothetical protein n=1 Tax=Streptomyces sp. NPDC057486 TaxID=3346145 RepID=UPI003687D093
MVRSTVGGFALSGLWHLPPYERTGPWLALHADGGRERRPHPLLGVIEAGSPILQQARYATELLPPDHRISFRKAQHDDDRRLSG